MKVKLTMEFDIPEDNYKDDEDSELDVFDRHKIELEFVRQFIFDGFVNHSRCAHLCDAMDWMDSDSPNKHDHLHDHREWIKILDEAEKTLKIEPLPMKFEDFKEEFDKALSNISDEELISGFASIGCDVEIRKDVYGGTSLEELGFEYKI